MAKGNEETGTQPGGEGVISIIGPGMKVVGDCDSKGTLRIEGTVEGTVRAGKAVVVGKDGVVDGDITTQDAVIGGQVNGSIVAESRLELQATCMVEGEIQAKRIKLEEGGTINGTVQIGDVSAKRHGKPLGRTDAPRPGGSTGDKPAPGSPGPNKESGGSGTGSS